MGSGIKALAGGAKLKVGQVIENKQFREMHRFRAPMISMAYDQGRETARFVWRKFLSLSPFCLPRRGPKRNGREINGGFWALAADVA
jgi:hypothetical protein